MRYITIFTIFDQRHEELDIPVHSFSWIYRLGSEMFFLDQGGK